MKNYWALFTVLWVLAVGYITEPARLETLLLLASAIGLGWCVRGEAERSGKT